MKNLKKQLCIIAAICCCAGFTACGDSARNSSTDDSSSEVKSDERDEKDSDDDSTDDNDAGDSDTNRSDDNVDDEEENENIEESDKSEKEDEQEEKTTGSKTESSFSPQFADEDDVEVRERIDPDDKTNVGYLINWKDSPCIGKGVTVDGIEICGGETLSDCDFDNWSMSYDYDSGDKILKSNCSNNIYYSHSSIMRISDRTLADLRSAFSTHIYELMNIYVYNDSSKEKIYDKCKISSFELGGNGETEDGDNVNAIDYFDMTDAVESSVELPYGVAWDMDIFDVYEILGTPYRLDIADDENSHGKLSTMEYYTIDKYHMITFTFNPDQNDELCSVKVYYDHLKDN